MRILALLAFVYATSVAAIADTVTLTSTRDNTLYQSATGSLSNGLGQHVFVGRTGQDDAISRRRALVRFDLSSIPLGSTVSSVTLTMNCSRANQSGPTVVAVHRAVADWGEGTSVADGQEGAGGSATANDATWIHTFYPSLFWSVPGGQFVATPSATTIIGNEGFYTWTSMGLLSDVQSWLAGSPPNYGWIVIGDESAPQTAKRLDSRHETNADRRPKLTVVYTPPAQPGACCLPSGCVQLTATECASQGGTFIGPGVPCSPDPCSGAELIFVSVKDNTLYESATGALSNGEGIGVFSGTADGLNRRRGLIQFDLSTVPQGAIITGANLSLYVSFTQANAADTMTLHRVFASWGEGTSNASGNESNGAASTTNDATWVHRFFNSTLWGTAGGDFSITPSASTLVGTANGFYVWDSANLAADVQSWVDAPNGNHGWLVLGNEAVNKSQRRFDSREAATPAQRPTLTITYALPPPTGACCLPDGMCIELTAAECESLGGVYIADGMPCSMASCAQPTGACCLAGALCLELTEDECLADGGSYQGDGTMCMDVTCPLALQPFVDPLPRPAIAQPTTGSAGGVATYVLAVTQFQQQLHRDLPATTVWGYGGSYPGPTIEASTGSPVTVTWANDLRDDQGNYLTEHYLPIDHCLHGPDMEGSTPRVVTHLHGGFVPAGSDGYPEFTDLPGESSTYVYPNTQPAGTIWYHDHALGITRLNVYLGLAGFYLIRDAAENALGLPSGEYEIPIAIQDRSFNADGSLAYPDMWMEHFFGDVILVNGKVWPYLEVKRGKYRLRTLNGSGSRTYTLALSDGATFWQIGTDSGLRASPVPLTSVTISPGERADLVFDFASYPAGTELLLTNSAPALFPGSPGEGVIPNVMKFVVLPDTGATAPLPSSLRPFQPISEADALTERFFELRKLPEECVGSHWLINGLHWDDITEVVRLDTTEVWSWVNRSGVTHPMHMHLVSFQVLDRQDFAIVANEVVPIGPRVPPAEYERGWKDTVQATPSQITRVIARFEEYEGLFPYHCHILEHEDHEMMRQFRTVPRADLDLDGAVSGADLAILLGAWSQSDPVADLDGDGIVSGADLAILLGAWTG
jgi:FtsP/CotA-like multicopper oxidase with cupredoxin domain